MKTFDEALAHVAANAHMMTRDLTPNDRTSNELYCTLVEDIARLWILNLRKALHANSQSNAIDQMAETCSIVSVAIELGVQIGRAMTQE